jgi:endonuclease G
LSGVEQGRPKGLAYIFDNEVSTGSLQNYSCTIDEVEEMTGIDFFHLLPDDVESKVEAR